MLQPRSDKGRASAMCTQRSGGVCVCEVTGRVSFAGQRHLNARPSHLLGFLVLMRRRVCSLVPRLLALLGPRYPYPRHHHNLHHYHGCDARIGRAGASIFGGDCERGCEVRDAAQGKRELVRMGRLRTTKKVMIGSANMANVVARSILTAHLFSGCLRRK